MEADNGGGFFTMWAGLPGWCVHAMERFLDLSYVEHELMMICMSLRVHL